MGLSSLAIVLNLIPQINIINLEINNLYQRKFALMRWAAEIGNGQSQNNRRRDGEIFRFKEIDFGTAQQRAEGVIPKYSSVKFKGYDLKNVETRATNGNWGDEAQSAATLGALQGFAPGGLGAGGARPVLDDKTHNFNFAMDADAVHAENGESVVLTYDGKIFEGAGQVMDPKGVALKDGERYMTKEMAEGKYKSYLNEINIQESEIDQRLAVLKAKLDALQQQRTEFEKYAAKAIQSSFQNPYMQG